MLAAPPSTSGNDSGVTHLAAAFGAPTLALFGPTDPASGRRWARGHDAAHAGGPHGPDRGRDGDRRLRGLTGGQPIGKSRRIVRRVAKLRPSPGRLLLAWVVQQHKTFHCSRTAHWRPLFIHPALTKGEDHEA